MDRAFYDRVARRLGEALARSGRSQVDVALRIGCNPSTVSRFLARTHRSLRMDALLRLALELDVPAEDLVPRMKPRAKPRRSA